MCNCNNTCSTCGNDKRCRLAVTVEDSFSPCTFRKKYFDVEIRNRDGSAAASGRVEAGGSEIFDLPCNGNSEYNVTVTGDPHSSPRSQTRRVCCCCCDSTSGVTFIFMSYEPDCEPKFCPPAVCPSTDCCKPCESVEYLPTDCCQPCTSTVYSPVMGADQIDAQLGAPIIEMLK